MDKELVDVMKEFSRSDRYRIWSEVRHKCCHSNPHCTCDLIRSHDHTRMLFFFGNCSV